ncbi:hypothetical protein PRIPAC_84307 [Pristionchus pacificus]|uniref:Uncharacterized protein n=1 Tax=Pristionchus pacificus TaxID=54126 RepID=A0A2A6BTD3_PRIPA|nr:hypothetical protein PRIPAC_84307 [Pristionchus pacificus]|eukprot:PDM69117.1 hypothetical protein PRIPAC_47419 [Pristionchus pacificus]
MVKDPLTGNDDLSPRIAILERSGSSPRRSSLKDDEIHSIAIEEVAVAYCALKKDREILTSELMTESLLAYELKDRVLTGSDSGLRGHDQMDAKKEHGWPTSSSCEALRRTDYRTPSSSDVPDVLYIFGAGVLLALFGVFAVCKQARIPLIVYAVANVTYVALSIAYFLVISRTQGTANYPIIILIFLGICCIIAIVQITATVTYVKLAKFIKDREEADNLSLSLH